MAGQTSTGRRFPHVQAPRHGRTWDRSRPTPDPLTAYFRRLWAAIAGDSGRCRRASDLTLYYWFSLHAWTDSGHARRFGRAAAAREVAPGGAVAGMSTVGVAVARGAVARATVPGRRWKRCSCGRPIPDEVRRCSARTCPEFAPTWARDTRRRLFVNLEQVKLSVMFSVTAPGADLYPFDPAFCSHPPGERCSGARGCRVNPEMAAAFNRHAGKWWSELHRAAKVRADRCDGLQGQDRGACVGEAEAGSCAPPRGDLGGVA